MQYVRAFDIERRIGPQQLAPNDWFIFAVSTDLSGGIKVR